jgi:hypothetical protein
MTTDISRLSGSLLIALRTSSPVQIRHHQIEQDETEFFLPDQRNRLVSAGRAGDPPVTIGFKQQLQRVSIVLIVIDDKDTGEIRSHEHPDPSSIG